MGDRLPGLRQTGAAVRHLPHAVGVRGRRRKQTLGHLAQCRAQRDPRVLRAGLLVRRAGHHPRPGPHLAERQRQGQGEGRRPARGRRRDGVRAVRTRTRRRHLQHRPAADTCRRGHRRGGVPCVRREVLHRQRQRGRDGVGVLPAHRHRRSGRVRLVRRRQRPRQLRADRQRGARPDVRQQFPAQRLPGVRGGHPVHRPGRLLRPRSTPSTSASSTCAVVRSACASTRSTRPSPTRTIASSTATRSPTSRMSAQASSTPTPGWSR